MTIILDASSAISMTLDPTHPDSKSANELIKKSDYIICPDIFVAEITYTLWKYCLYEKMEVDKAIEYAESVLSLVDQFIVSNALWQDALEIGLKKSHSTYDCFYLALAIEKNAILLTRDKKLKQLAQAENIKTV